MSHDAGRRDSWCSSLIHIGGSLTRGSCPTPKEARSTPRIGGSKIHLNTDRRKFINGMPRSAHDFPVPRHVVQTPKKYRQLALVVVHGNYGSLPRQRAALEVHGRVGPFPGNAQAWNAPLLISVAAVRAEARFDEFGHCFPLVANPEIASSAGYRKAGRLV